LILTAKIFTVTHYGAQIKSKWQPAGQAMPQEAVAVAESGAEASAN